MTIISINSMLQGEFSTPLFPGNRLERVGKFLGVPERWDFGIEDEFIFQLGYGDFELNLRTQANRVEVERVWIELWDTSADKPIPKTDRIRLTQGTQVELGEFAAGLPLSAAKRALQALKLPYEEITQEDGSEVIKRLLLPTRAELFFFEGKQEPVLMEIHFFAKADAAM